MNAPIDDGGSFFPKTITSGDKSISEGGLSIRDWFAGQALNGFCSDGRMLKATHDALETGKSVAVVLAVSAYDAADAMLAARKENK